MPGRRGRENGKDNFRWFQETFNPLYRPHDDEEHRCLTCFEQAVMQTPEEKYRIKHHMVAQRWFNPVTITVVVVNACFIGIQADSVHSTQIQDAPVFFAADCFFFLFFFSEMLLRMTQHYWEYFAEGWNLFDYFVICLSLFDIAVAVITGVTGAFRMALAVRILRVARIIKYIRGMEMFYRLWMTIKGLVDAMKTILWVALMLLIIVYCTAIALLTVLQDAEGSSETWLDKDVYFGTVYRTMWTVFQFISFDAWAQDIMRPLLPISWIAAAILFLMIVVGSFGVINVIVAVMVESARANSAENKAFAAKIMEKMDAEILKALGESFVIADEDESNELDREEFIRFLERPDVAFKMRLLGINCDEADRKSVV